MNNADNAREQFVAEWNELQSAWKNSRFFWKDDVAVQFENRFMAPFCVEIPAFLMQLEDLCGQMQRIRREIQ